MGDSDSDDELMNRLTHSLSMNFAVGSGEECAYCNTDNAPLVCTVCTTAAYCNEVSPDELSPVAETTRVSSQCTDLTETLLLLLLWLDDNRCASEDTPAFIATSA